MREYATREEAEQDPTLNLRIIYRCSKCRAEREDYPNCNVDGDCRCGGKWQKIGESYEG